MDTILKLIIIPFKLPRWIENDNYNLMDNKHKFLKHYLKRYYKNNNWLLYMCRSPIMADEILNRRCPIVLSLFANPSPILTKLIIEKFKLGGLRYLTKNTNPELAKFIISHKNNFNNECWSNVFGNHNSGLTEFIKENHSQIKYPCNLYLDSNTNPELAELVLSSLNPTDSLAENPNPGLTKYLHSSGLLRVDNNTNPELAPVIIERILNGCPIRDIYKNSNDGLVLFILYNLPKEKKDWNEMVKNTNPAFEKYIYDNRDKISPHYLHYLAKNKYIFEPVKLNL